FPRHGSRLHLNEGQSVSRPNKCHQIMRASVPAGTVSLVPVLPKAAGHDGISRNRSPSGDVAYAAVSNVVSLLEFNQGQTPQNNGDLQMQESPGNLENPAVPRGVRPHGHSDAPRSGNHR